MPVSLDDRVFPSESVLCKDVGNEAVLLDLESESYFGLNAVGTRCWTLFATTPRIGDAIEILAREYDAPPDQLRRDVEELVEALVRRGLLRTARE